MWHSCNGGELEFPFLTLVLVIIASHQVINLRTAELKMDRSWIDKPRTTKEYKVGIQSFIEFASMNGLVNEKVLCPCRKCKNKHYLLPEQVHEHLIWNGFLTGYNIWFFHGESCLESQSSNMLQDHDSPLRNNDSYVNLDGQEDLRGLFSAAMGSSLANNVQNDVPFGVGDGCSNPVSSSVEPDVAHEKVSPLQKLMSDCEKPLYPNCESFSVISFILHIWNAKTVGGWSRESFDMLFEILRVAFPEATFPSSYYDAKKLIKELGLGYEKIHACPNDCMLYWGENDKYSSCQTCGLSRWTNNKKDITENNPDDTDSSRRKKKPAKVLRYFPLIPRLKRLYMSKDIASSMRWHEEGRTKDGVLRHPADALAWKAFDRRHPDFAADPRNVRLGLASDGFNPFRTMSSAYSTWPVILIPYNMEPWSCMRKSSLILSMVIPGEKGPGNDIDIYLKPLIEELKQLWNGVEAYDALKGEQFILRASLMWTVNDFPAYANLSGWSTKGKSKFAESVSLNPHEDPIAVEQNVYHEVICGDKPKRIRGYGLGVTPTMVRWSQKRNMTEQEVERRVEARLEIEREVQRKETDEKLRQQEERMSAQMGDMLKRVYENVTMQFQSMQSSYQAQIAKLQTNMDGFNSFQRFMASSAGDFTPSASLGCSTIPLSNANQFNFTGYGFGSGVHPANSNFTQIFGSGNGPTSTNVVNGNGAPTNPNQTQIFGSGNGPTSTNVVNVNGAPTNPNQGLFTAYRGGASTNQNTSSGDGTSSRSVQSRDGASSESAQSGDGTSSGSATD